MRTSRAIAGRAGWPRSRREPPPVAPRGDHPGRARAGRLVGLFEERLERPPLPRPRVGRKQHLDDLAALGLRALPAERLLGSRVHGDDAKRWSTVTIGSTTASTIAAFNSGSDSGDRAPDPCRRLASWPSGTSNYFASCAGHFATCGKCVKHSREVPGFRAPRKSGGPGCATFGRLTNDEVDELARNDNSFCKLSTVQVGFDLRRLAGKPLLLLSRRAGRHLDPVAQLPVHLDDELERVGDEQVGVGLRPRLLPYAPARSSSRRPPSRGAARTGRRATPRSRSRSGSADPRGACRSR